MGTYYKVELELIPGSDFRAPCKDESREGMMLPQASEHQTAKVPETGEGAPNRFPPSLSSEGSNPASTFISGLQALKL